VDVQDPGALRHHLGEIPVVVTAHAEERLRALQRVRDDQGRSVLADQAVPE
jgi:hypothetical protein